MSKVNIIHPDKTLSIQSPEQKINVVHRTQTVNLNNGGRRGLPGEPGDKNYIQSFTNRDVLTIHHNLNKNPAVTVIDSAGTQVEGTVEYIDLNTVKLAFSSPFSGKATLN